MTKRNLLMYVGAVLAIALFTFGCGGDDDGLSAEDMARLASAEQAAADALAAVEAAAEAADDDVMEPEPEPGYQPDDPGGTLEGQAGRAAAQRIVNARSDDEIAGGASIKSLDQAPLGDDPMLTITIEGGSDLGTADNSADMDAPEIAGFDGVSLMKDGPGAVTQTALVYSDADRSVRAFGDVYRYNVDATGMNTEMIVEAGRTHILIGDAMEAMADSKVALIHGLSTTSGVTTRALAGENQPNTMRGSYDGVAGQYTFNTGGTVTLVGDKITLTDFAAITFRADDHETLMPDTDYLAFGVWAEVPDSPTTANYGKVRPFVDGSARQFDIEDVQGLTGSAEYAGGAVGHYATRAKGAHMVEEGRFTASATLEANFDKSVGADYTAAVAASNGEAAVPASVTPTGEILTGKITDFMTEDGMEMPGWIVNLKGGMMTPDLDVADNAANAAAAANADEDAAGLAAGLVEVDVLGYTDGTTGSQAFTGVWEAWMFGNNPDNYPTGVAGNFQAATGTAQPWSTNEGRINLFYDEGFAGVVGSFATR